MSEVSGKDRRVLEIALIVVCIGLACLLYAMQGYKIVVLNLFFLPVVLGGLYLGRYQAGILALFCAIAASAVTALNLPAMTGSASPLVTALAVAVWAAALGLTAMLVGTLSDDRTTKARQLHDANVGVIEVLSHYLQSAHPRLQSPSIRVAELSEEVASVLRLPPHQVDDIRVAALLHDMGNVEITTNAIRRAVGSLEDEGTGSRRHTFPGADLMFSLGSVLSGAVPLLLGQEGGTKPKLDESEDSPAEVPIGAKIIRTARSYVSLIDSDPTRPLEDVIVSLRAGGHDPAVVDALRQVLSRPAASNRDTERQPVGAGAEVS